ncbi:MAG: peroxiredoxin [Leptospiraceae bacterium]|nr:peroxiredoxin [Leptospiraceae bacterium]MDW7977004.1 peroxiredoxin [Leptospiraceae bacterium]
MKKTFFGILSLLLAFPLVANSKVLKPGDKAPDFVMYLDDGKKVNLYSFLNQGKKIVLYFYPKDDTYGCTAQAINIRDNLIEFQKRNILVFGISTDDLVSHRNFKQKHKLNFPLVSDFDKSISRAYGVLSMFGIAQRVTFVIRSDGIIEHVITDVDVDRHTQQIIELIDSNYQRYRI